MVDCVPNHYFALLYDAPLIYTDTAIAQKIMEINYSLIYNVNNKFFALIKKVHSFKSHVVRRFISLCII